MNRQDFVKVVAEKLDASQKDTGDILRVFEESVKEILATDEVNLNNFLKFEVKNVAERNGVNPATGAKLTIPAHKAVKVKVLKGLKECIEG